MITVRQGKQPGSKAKKLYDKAVNKKIRMALVASGMTIKQMCELSKIPEASMYHILSGKHAISMYYASKVCTVLGIDANYLLGVKGEKR